MIWFKCNGEPYVDEQLLKEAVNNWATKKGVDPEKVYSANVWDKYKKPNQGFKIKPGQPINTSIFEEAEVIDD